MNQPLSLGKKVYLRGEWPRSFFGLVLYDLHQINIGLTNKNPVEIRGSRHKKEAIGNKLSPVYCRGTRKSFFSTNEFYFSISLYPNNIGMIMISFANEQQVFYSYPDISTTNPIWLVFELCENKKIRVSDTYVN